MSQIRVLHLITTMIPNGGVQSFLRSYAQALSDYEIAFDYVVQGVGDPELEQRCRDAGSRFFSVPDSFRDPVGFAAAYYRLLKTHPEYRIVHVHQNFINIVPLLVARAAGVPVRISHSHNNYATSRFKQLLRRISRVLLSLGATEKWACSEVAYQWLYGKAYTGVPHSHILHNAIDTRRFAFRPEQRAQLRAAEGLTDEFVCIYVANLSHRKNQMFLLDVIKRVREDAPERSVLLWLVGDGDIRSDLEARCQALGITDIVRFFGARSDVPDLLQMADCFLFPSHAEGLGICAVEAQACGLPCILSTDIPSEVCLSPNVVFLPNDVAHMDAWAKQLLTFAEQAVNRTVPLPDHCGYDITQEAGDLAAQYRRLLTAVE